MKTSEIKPGIYPDMSNDDYHGGPGISKSGLDLISKNPALYKDRYIDGNRPEPTKPMIVGSATHTAVLEPEKFDKEYIVAPAVDRRTKTGKAAYAEFMEKAEAEQLIPLKADEYENIMRIAEAVRAHPVASQIFSKGQAETSIFHHDELTGELVKVRPDWITDDLLVDLKTTQDASMEAFERACWNFRYYVQSPMYLDIANEQSGFHYNSFLFVCVESNEPYSIAVYYADQEMMDAGRMEYRRCMEIYHQHKQQNQWPGLNDDKISPISIPYWAMRKVEEKSMIGTGNPAF